MADDYQEEYLKYREEAAKENGPLADFLRQNADKFVEKDLPEKEEPDNEQAQTKKKSVFSKALDYMSFMLRPLGALQETAIAPIAHDYESTSFLGQIGESFGVSGKALKNALLPSMEESRPEYEKKIIEEAVPNMPDWLKPGAETFLGVASDPAVLAFPFMSTIKKGLQVGAAQREEVGPWTRALQEAVSIGPTTDEERKRIESLAMKADSGNIGAGKELNSIMNEQEINKAATERILSVFGDQSKPLVEVIDKKTAKAFLDIPKSELPKHAININLSRINTPDDIKSLINDASKVFAEDINVARRGKQSNEETIKLANSLNLQPEELLARRKGIAFNAEEAYAARQILVSSGEKLQEIARKVLDPNAGPLDKVAFRKQLAVHKAIQEQVSGMTAEAGRALQQFNIQSQSTKVALRQIDDIMTAMGDRGVLTEDMARALIDMKSPEQIASFVNKSFAAKTSDIIFEAWINGLLSGPQTHAVNTISNSLVALWQIPERAFAAGISKTLNSGQDGVMASEALGQVYGLFEGFKDGLKAFGKTMVTGESEDIVGKLETPMRAAISSKALNVSGNAGRAIDYLGRMVRLPGTMLTAEDAFFKSVGYRMELHARAFRQAAEEGLKGEEAGKRIASILANPPEDLHLAAIDAARYQTFTNPLGPAGRAYQRIVTNLPVLRIVTPFIRTPTNIFKFFGERSPFAPLAKSFRADIKAGGARRDLALARMSMGSMVMGLAAKMAGEGKITGGGPTDQELKANLYNAGWQPYSIKVGNKYISYARLEPLGTLLGVAADFSEIAGEVEEKEAQEIAAHLSMAVAKNVTSKTFMRGLSEMVHAMDDPQRYGEKYWLNLMQTAIPTGVAQIARVQDPYLRETRTVTDRMLSRIPGYSKDLPPRRNVFGEPIRLSGGLGPDIISPFYISEAKNDPVYDELVKIEVRATMPSKNIRGIELDPKQYDQLVVLTAGPVEEGEPTLKEDIALAMKEPDWDKLTDGPEGGKAYRIRKILLSHKAAGRALFLERNPQFKAQLETMAEERENRFIVE